MNDSLRKPSAPPSPFSDPDAIILGDTSGVGLLNKCKLMAYQPLPLPGIVIFVHGVNSDGEWYKAAEQGLCAGLNNRLKRNDHQMACPSAAGGQLTPVSYMAELTDDGYLNPKRSAKTFIRDDPHCSPVIQFRWGYKANPSELQRYGTAIYLNEENYWGGGPFANGCTSLPDLWNEGVSAQLFLWWQVHHFNPVKTRPVYSCPSRPYFVLAALRLARLIESIRNLQSDVPITIVCHSQGNMVAMAAAFLGDRLPPVTKNGQTRRCVADTYVLCSPPYSLQPATFMENWSETHMKDREGGCGRQTVGARVETMAKFFDIIRRSATDLQKDADIDEAMANDNHQFNAAADRAAHGYGPHGTCGRVTLYCNPHDQVISAATIRGIGWLGMSQKEIDATNGNDLFCQRIFASNFPIGDATRTAYNYWTNHYRDKVRKQNYWWPPSPPVTYNFSFKDNGSVVGTVVTALAAPVLIIATKVFDKKVNEVPPDGWTIPLKAPKLPSAFKPKLVRFGQETEDFDDGYDTDGEQRDRQRVRSADDPYAGDREIKQQPGQHPRDTTDAAKGDRDSEAQLRYEHHGRLRMEARREGLVAKDAQFVTEEDKPEEASDKYRAWRTEKIKGYLEASLDNNATDHSSLLTNPEHAEKALAYDVAVGVGEVDGASLQQMRILADWRFLLNAPEQHAPFRKYFMHGKIDGVAVDKWVASSPLASMPNGIADEREFQPNKNWMSRGD